MLYLVPTPIGNLADITFRAVNILKSCDYVLCEDTRHSQILLKHYEISKPLKSFHKFNETSKEDRILKDLEAGMNIALISDAGTPGISDPGTDLVKKCIERNIVVDSLPGPCAAITALAASGLETDRFQFYGFLPKKLTELKSCLVEILDYEGTTICYESPLRLQKTLKEISGIDGSRYLVVCRELTKKYQEIVRGAANELVGFWKEGRVKGEIVLLISRNTTNDPFEWASLTPLEHVQFLEREFNMEHRRAIKKVAELRGLKKRDIYQFLLENKQELI